MTCNSCFAAVRKVAIFCQCQNCQTRESMTVRPLVSWEIVSRVFLRSKQLVKNNLRQSDLSAASYRFELIQRLDFIQMKYSITAGQGDGHLLPFSGTFIRLFSNYHTTYAFTLTDNKAKLYHLAEQTQAAQVALPHQSTAEFVTPKQINWQRLKHIEQTPQEWLLFLESPLQILFYLKKYQTLVPIILEEQPDVEQITCYVTYPQLLLYGYSPQAKANIMYTVNLTTFQLKSVSNAKDYSPGNRSHFWSHFSDDRLYIMGGNCNIGEIDKLMWTYNMDNGYWFALQVNEPVGCLLNCQFENGKVLAVGTEDLYVVQLYQSRVARVEGWREVLSEEELKTVTGVYVCREKIYLFMAGHRIMPLMIVKSKAGP